MDIGFTTLILLPIGLGLLGFIEPCTIGGHLLFLDTQKSRSRDEKIRAVLIFISLRSLVAGLFGALIAFLGSRLIGIQTGLWLVFGMLYVTFGLVYLFGRSRWIKWQINLAPEPWRKARNPVVLGAAFGLNIPACAAPILFGLLGLAASTGTVATGFFMMFLFGLFLSAPLALFAFVPGLSGGLDRLGGSLRKRRRIIGLIFVALGFWSIWFGLYVDPADWSGQ